MRIHAASASAAVTRTLNALITASGHDIATTADAELLLFDQTHPLSEDLPTCPRVTLGSGAEGETIATPLRPHQLLRLLATRKATPSLLPLGAGWNVDLLARSITHAYNDAETLTEKECALLGALLQQPEGLSREALLAEVWGVRADIDTHTLETHIYRLRAKLNGLTPVPCDLVSEDSVYKIIQSAV